MKSRWSNDISQRCIMKSGNLSWIIQALIHALVPFPWPPFCSIGPRVSAWIFSPFNHLPLPFPLFVSISTLKRLLLTCYRMRQLSVCCRALSLSGDKMVIKTKSDTSNANLLLSFSAYCFFFPKHDSIFFFSKMIIWKRIRMHICYSKSSQYLVVWSAKMMWPITIFKPMVQACRNY